jgi:hypothetical protein
MTFEYVNGHRNVLASAVAVLGAVLLLVLPATVDAARPRHACPKSYTRTILGVSLSASFFRPGCGGAALMASDIRHAAARRFPRALPNRYTAYAHGTNTAGDPRARYRCAITNRFYTAEQHPVRRTTALCVNVAGDNFRYVFDMA